MEHPQIQKKQVIVCDYSFASSIFVPMKKLIPIILLSVLAMVVSCSHGPQWRQLTQVDSLMTQSLRDSAWHVFKQIDPEELNGEDERMYYDVLKCELGQQVVSADSLHFDEPYDSVLSRCIAYYQHANEPRNLVRAYLNKGKFLLEHRHQHEQASTWLKLAEEALPKAHDVRLSYQTYEALATLNYYSGNDSLAMDYSYKTLACAEQSGNHHQMTYACNHLVVLYMARHEPDSVRKYSNRSMSLLSQMPAKDRSFALANLAAIYMGNNLLDSAETYLEKARTELSQPFIYQRLAEISYLRGDHAQADTLWAKAMRTTDLRDRVEAYQSMVGKKYGAGDYRGTADAAIRLLELKDSLVQQMKTAEVQEIQLKYDKEVERRKLDRFMMWSLVVALALVALIAAGVIYHIRKASRVKEKMTRDQVLINDYRHQIELLQSSGQDVTREVRTLQKKIDTLQSEQTEKLSEGRELYRRVVDGETAVAWSKDQLLKFIEYYKVVNLPFMMQMEREYTRLSPGNRFFLILQDMGKTDDEMTHILGVSEGALRTTRSRLRQKRTAPAKLEG